MLGAIRLKVTQMHKGFSGADGWEFEYVILAAALALVFTGAGRISLDRVLLHL